MSRYQKGFTLIELLIVVAIIGILASIAAPKFADLVIKSKEASVKGSLGALRSAVTIYYADTEGVFPTNLFNALALPNKYMPPISGVKSLGRFAIPAVKNVAGSGHVKNGWLNVTAATMVTVTHSENATNPLYYNRTQGLIVLNCRHMDSKNIAWSSY